MFVKKSKKKTHPNTAPLTLSLFLSLFLQVHWRIFTDGRWIVVFNGTSLLFGGVRKNLMPSWCVSGWCCFSLSPSLFFCCFISISLLGLHFSPIFRPNHIPENSFKSTRFVCISSALDFFHLVGFSSSFEVLNWFSCSLLLDLVSGLSLGLFFQLQYQSFLWFHDLCVHDSRLVSVPFGLTREWSGLSVLVPGFRYTRLTTKDLSVFCFLSTFKIPCAW